MLSSRDVIIRAENLDAAKAFYHGVMGFTIVCDTDGLLGFETGSFTLYVEPGSDPTPVFDFETASFEETKARLLAHGCTPVEENPAIPRFYVRDPFGLAFNIAEG